MRQLLSRLSFLFRYAWGMSLFINVLLLVSPLYMLQVFDRVLSSRSAETLVVLTLGTVVALMMLGVLESIRSRLLVQAGVAIDGLFGARVYKEILRKAVLPNGVRYAVALRDLNQLRQFLTGNATLALFDSPWAPVFLVVIFIMHWALGVTALVGIVILAALAVWDERTTRPRIMEANGLAQGVSRLVDQSIRNSEVAVAMGMSDALVARWRERSNEVGALQERASNRSGTIVALTKFFRLLLQVAMLGVGAYLVMHDNMSSGIMMAATIIVGKALAPIELAISSWRQFIEVRGAYARLSKLVEGIPDAASRVDLPEPRGKVSVEGVVFGVQPDRPPTLKGVSFALEAGESLGVIGPSAAGKSTLARVLMGLWAPRAGVVRLDGADVAQWPHERLGKYVGYLPQDVELFAGTVGDNIARMGAGEANSDEIVKAAMIAGAHELILRLPEGYETQVGESGEFLSGGQRQRIALARAVFGTPKLVVLDEPNSSLDADGEIALVGALEALKQARVTVVIISHKPSLLAGVDKLLVLQNGAVELYGPREEVLQKFRPQRPAAVPIHGGVQARPV